MTQQLSLVLLITLVGMGLVFTVLILLQALMTILVRFTAEKHTVTGQPIVDQDDELRKQAAVIAVSIALAEKDERTQKEFPLPPTAIVSAWQLAQRANSLNRRGPSR